MKFVSESDSSLYHELRARLQGTTTWKRRIELCMPESQFFPPASKSDLEAIQQALGHGIPNELGELLAESNGVESPYSSLVYNASRIIEVNQTFRTADYLADRMPFDHLLFFGTVSNGDEFAFPIFRNDDFGGAVFLWSHESDCREEYAMSLTDYITRYTAELYTPYMNTRNSPLKDR